MKEILISILEAVKEIKGVKIIDMNEPRTRFTIVYPGRHAPTFVFEWCSTSKPHFIVKRISKDPMWVRHSLESTELSLYTQGDAVDFVQYFKLNLKLRAARKN